MAARPRWPPTRATYRRASEGAFQHVLEALGTKGALLAGVRAQLLQVVGCDACVQALLIGTGAFVWGTSHRECHKIGGRMSRQYHPRTLHFVGADRPRMSASEPDAICRTPLARESETDPVRFDPIFRPL